MLTTLCKSRQRLPGTVSCAPDQIRMPPLVAGRTSDGLAAWLAATVHWISADQSKRGFVHASAFAWLRSLRLPGYPRIGESTTMQFFGRTPSPLPPGRGDVGGGSAVCAAGTSAFLKTAVAGCGWLSVKTSCVTFRAARRCANCDGPMPNVQIASIDAQLDVLKWLGAGCKLCRSSLNPIIGLSLKGVGQL